MGVNAFQGREQIESRPRQLAGSGPARCDSYGRFLEKLHREEGRPGIERPALGDPHLVRLDDVRVTEPRLIDELSQDGSGRLSASAAGGSCLDRHEPLRDEIEATVDRGGGPAADEPGENPPLIDRIARQGPDHARLTTAASSHGQDGKVLRGGAAVLMGFHP